MILETKKKHFPSRVVTTKDETLSFLRRSTKYQNIRRLVKHQRISGKKAALVGKKEAIILEICDISVCPFKNARFLRKILAFKQKFTTNSIFTSIQLEIVLARELLSDPLENSIGEIVEEGRL